MKLLKLVEPLFQYVCALNRSPRKGAEPQMEEARARMKSLLFDELKARAAGDHLLSEQYENVKLPLVFFVDSMIAESDLEFARQWDENRIAYELKELAGDEKFFQLLDETLADDSEEANERLMVFYTCIGLGFTGMYAGREEKLQAKMKQIAARIRRDIDVDETRPICPQAYEHVDTRDLTEPPGRKLLTIALIFVALIIVFFVANVALYEGAGKELEESLKAVSEGQTTIATTTEAPEEEGN